MDYPEYKNFCKNVLSIFFYSVKVQNLEQLRKNLFKNYLKTVFKEKWKSELIKIEIMFVHFIMDKDYICHKMYTSSNALITHHKTKRKPEKNISKSAQ